LLSHAVGLELYNWRWLRPLELMSPSHAVGLERKIEKTIKEVCR